MTNVVMVLLIAVLVAIVSVQNATPVSVSFLFWKVETPLFIVIILSILAGILLAVVALISTYLKKRLSKNGRTTSTTQK